MIDITICFSLRSMLLGESYTDPVTYIVGNLFALLLEEKVYILIFVDIHFLASLFLT